MNHLQKQINETIDQLRSAVHQVDREKPAPRLGCVATHSRGRFTRHLTGKLRDPPRLNPFESIKRQIKPIDKGHLPGRQQNAIQRRRAHVALQTLKPRIRQRLGKGPFHLLNGSDAQQRTYTRQKPTAEITTCAARKALHDLRRGNKQAHVTGLIVSPFNPIRQTQRPTAQMFNHPDLKFLAISGSRTANSREIEDEPTLPPCRVAGKGVRSINWRAGLIRHTSDHIGIKFASIIWKSAMVSEKQKLAGNHYPRSHTEPAEKIHVRI